MSKIKVAIDENPLAGGHSVRGIGFHTRNLVEEFRKNKNENIEIQVVDFKRANLNSFDLVHYPLFNPFFLTLPGKFPAKSLVTIHDLIYLVFPKVYPPGVRGNFRFMLQKKRVRDADGILTISKTSKADIIKYLDIAPDRIFVVHLAPGRTSRPIKDEKLLGSIRLKYNLPKEFILYVGDVNYNKNILTLIKACENINKTLVIVGKQALDIEERGTSLKDIYGPQDWIRFILNKPHPELAHFDELLKQFKNLNTVKRLGFVPDSDLLVIFSLASVYCQPSLYEGFALPVLEAMACGIPVVASDIGVHKEIAGEAVLYANPQSPDDLAKMLLKVIESNDLKSELIKKGLKKASEYSWNKTAKETLEVYKTVIRI